MGDADDGLEDDGIATENGAAVAGGGSRRCSDDEACTQTSKRAREGRHGRHATRSDENVGLGGGCFLARIWPGRAEVRLHGDAERNKTERERG
jgi:hypothetical protein